MRSMTRIRNQGISIAFSAIVSAGHHEELMARLRDGDRRRPRAPRSSDWNRVEADRHEERLLTDHQVGGHEHPGRAENQEVAAVMRRTSQEPDGQGQEPQAQRHRHQLGNPKQAKLRVDALDER